MKDDTMPIFSGTLFSEALDKKIKINAVIPAPGPTKEANVTTTAPLKTLYLLHGWNGNEDDWIHYTSILELAEQHNLAVIMPDGENSFYSNHVNGAQYEVFYAKELIEQTRFLFPLSTKKAGTFIGGLSMGGYGALKLGYKYSEQFGKIIALSSRILHKNEKYTRDNLATQHINDNLMYKFGIKSFNELSSEYDIYDLIKHSQNHPDLFLACGEEDFLYNENKDLHNWLMSQDVNHQFQTSSGDHSWSYWRQMIYPAIDWLLKK